MGSELKDLDVTGEEEEEVQVVKPRIEPPYGTVDWIYFWSVPEGELPTPINVSITGSIKYTCDELKLWNFDVYPHKIKITNTGFTVVAGAKWRTERPYLTGGPLYGKNIFSQIHFHWGADMMEGSDHTVDDRKHPGEMHVTYFNSEYLTQEEALKHEDGVVVVCYLIQYGVTPDEKLQRFIEAFPRIQEAHTNTRMGPYPLSELLPQFYEDYFLYWGRLKNVRGDKFVVRWLIPRASFFASYDQILEFRKLLDPFDEPIIRNYRPLRPVEDRHIFFINAHWSQHCSLLPVPRIPEKSISELSPAYKSHPWMLPPQNRAIIEAENSNEENDKK